MIVLENPLKWVGSWSHSFEEGIFTLCLYTGASVKIFPFSDTR